MSDKGLLHQHLWSPIFAYPDSGEDYSDRQVARYCAECGGWEDLSLGRHGELCGVTYGYECDCGLAR